MLACTVRGCALPLERRSQVFRCPVGHSYDIARSGYINLLQPQDRRSSHAGDSRAALEARAELLAAAVGRTMIEAFARRAVALGLPDGAAVVDLGAGFGDVLAAISHARRIDGIGIDLSALAVERAARRHPSLLWVVANADRRLPFLDGSMALVISYHGRRNPTECARVLHPSGFLLVAVPAPDDLIELRTVVGGQAAEKDRAGGVLDDHASGFVLLDRCRIGEQHTLSSESLRRLLRGTYRGARHRVASRVDTLEGMSVTLASDVLLFSPRSRATPGSDRSP